MAKYSRAAAKRDADAWSSEAVHQEKDGDYESALESRERALRLYSALGMPGRIADETKAVARLKRVIAGSEPDYFGRKRNPSGRKPMVAKRKKRKITKRVSHPSTHEIVFMKKHTPAAARKAGFVVGRKVAHANADSLTHVHQNTRGLNIFKAGIIDHVKHMLVSSLKNQYGGMSTASKKAFLAGASSGISAFLKTKEAKRLIASGPKRLAKYRAERKRLDKEAVAHDKKRAAIVKKLLAEYRKTPHSSSAKKKKLADQLDRMGVSSRRIEGRPLFAAKAKKRKPAKRRNPTYAPKQRGSAAFHKFFTSYVETALWASTDDNGESLDIFRPSDIDDKTFRRMEKDCISFMRANKEDIDSDYIRAGHDFWLTRNRHGAGFWDGDWPKAEAKRLTDSSHAYGDYDLMYDEESGEIHGYP